MGRLTVGRNSSWREIRIQVDVPLMDASFRHLLLNLSHVLTQIPQILAAVHFRIVATGLPADPESKNQLPPLYAGQPISALISIQTSFHWGTRRDSGRKSYEMRFDIEEMVRDWLISGRKRGDFKAEVCTHQSDRFWES